MSNNCRFVLTIYTYRWCVKLMPWNKRCACIIFLKNTLFDINAPFCLKCPKLNISCVASSGERLSPWVAFGCFAMGVSTIFFWRPKQSSPRFWSRLQKLSQKNHVTLHSCPYFREAFCFSLTRGIGVLLLQALHVTTKHQSGLYPCWEDRNVIVLVYALKIVLLVKHLARAHDGSYYLKFFGPC
jgi:hypothetical protein